MRKFELKIEEQDIREVANAFVSYQYAMYGLSNVPEDILKEAAVNMLQDQRHHVTGLTTSVAKVHNGDPLLSSSY